jgi:LDH2 family malate/lactate/ureidoglycolate dehydrogenase
MSAVGCAADFVTEMGMNRYPKEELQNLVSQLASAMGVPAQDAALFAEVLVDADLHGVSTHGVSRLNIYFRRIEAGLIDPKAALAVDKKTGSILALDAGNGLGQVQARKALDMLMPLARQNGVAAATIRNSQHFGALSWYCNYAASQGLVLLAMTNCEPAMSPEGGYEAFFGTNPIAASFPTGNGFPVKIDLSTSIVARGNIIAAQKRNEPIPPGWALDRDGKPTTDASEALLGTVLTMAGHKGYALALMVELFSGVLSGAAIGPDVGSMYKNLDRKMSATSSVSSISPRSSTTPSTSAASTRPSTASRPPKYVPASKRFWSLESALRARPAATACRAFPSPTKRLRNSSSGVPA